MAPDLDALESRDEREPLADDEIAQLASLLDDDSAGAPAQGRALLLLARRHTADAEHALHALLERPADAAVAAEALRTLCLRWRLGDRYAGVLRHFVRGVRWDVERGGDVRRAAIGIAGELLAERTDTELMFDLIRISEDEPDEAARAAAVRALARATAYRGRPVDLRLDP
ncbi:MAG: hypothetical protein IVW36_08840 [Dehalococcoidia bacterium]|nr:hypothetical protein [Dehalococcoidia bacterium]